MALRRFAYSPPKQKNAIHLSEVQQQEMESSIKEAFDLFANVSGVIDSTEAKDAVNALGFRLTDEEIRKMTTNVQPLTYGNGTIEFKDFQKMMTHKIFTTGPVDDMKKAFHAIVAPGGQLITFEDLKRVSTQLGERMTDAALQEMINGADTDHKGGVSEEEFCKTMGKNGLFSKSTAH